MENKNWGGKRKGAGRKHVFEQTPHSVMILMPDFWYKKIKEHVAAGFYPTVSEAVRQALKAVFGFEDGAWIFDWI